MVIGSKEGIFGCNKIVLTNAIDIAFYKILSNSTSKGGM